MKRSTNQECRTKKLFIRFLQDPVPLIIGTHQYSGVVERMRGAFIMLGKQKIW
jgi:hypothetical protein